MPGIAETIRQGLFQEEFEKIRNDKKENERRDANSALNASRFEREGEQANIRNAREDKRDEFSRTNRTEDLAHRSSQDELTARAQAATIASRTASKSRDAARDAATANERGLAGEQRSQVLDNQGKIIEGRQEDQSAARKARLHNSIAGNLEAIIDAHPGDEDIQRRVEQELRAFRRDPDGWLEQNPNFQPEEEEEGQGAFGKAFSGLLKYGSDLAGGV